MEIRFQLGDLVRLLDGPRTKAGRIGKIADQPEPIKKYREANGQGKYVQHVRIDPTDGPVYWVEFVDAMLDGPSATEVEEFALEPAK